MSDLQERAVPAIGAEFLGCRCNNLRAFQRDASHPLSITIDEHEARARGTSTAHPIKRGEGANNAFPLFQTIAACVSMLPCWLVACSGLVGFDLDLFGEPFVVFAKDGDDFVAAEVIGQIPAFGEHFTQHGAGEQHAVFLGVRAGAE